VEDGAYRRFTRRELRRRIARLLVRDRSGLVAARRPSTGLAHNA